MPVAGEHMRAGDDHIDLARARLDGLLDLTDALGKRRLAGWETGGNRSYRDIRAAQRLDGILDPAGIDTDRSHVDLFALQGHPGKHIRTNGMFGLCAQTLDTAGSVVASQGGQVNTGDCAQEPGSLPILLDGAAFGQGFDAPLDRAAVHMRAHHPVQVKGHSRVSAVCRIHGLT